MVNAFTFLHHFVVALCHLDLAHYLLTNYSTISTITVAY